MRLYFDGYISDAWVTVSVPLPVLTLKKYAQNGCHSAFVVQVTIDFELFFPVKDNFDTEYGYERNQSSLKDKLKLKAKKQCACSKDRLLNTIISLFPILKWFPVWLQDWKINSVADLLAGLTVGIMSIPQGND